MITIFDLSNNAREVWVAVLMPILVLGIFGVVNEVVQRAGLLWSPYGISPKVVRVLLIVTGLIVGGTQLAMVYVPYRRAIESLHTKSYMIAEGEVSDFHPGQCERPAHDESFSISGKQFIVECSWSIWFRGFSPTHFPGIENPEGRDVQIIYLDGPPLTILRVEVKK